MNLLKSIVAAALVTAAASSFAAYPNSDVGPYVSIDTGLATQAGMSTATSTKRTYGVTAGYNFDSELGAEVTFIDLGQRQLTSGSLGTISWNSSAASIAATVRSELMHNVEVSGKLGLASTSIDLSLCSASASTVKAGLLVGVGADFRFDRKWSVKTTLDVYPNFAGTNQSMSLVTVGVKYRF